MTSYLHYCWVKVCSLEQWLWHSLNIKEFSDRSVFTVKTVESKWSISFINHFTVSKTRREFFSRPGSAEDFHQVVLDNINKICEKNLNIFQISILCIFSWVWPRSDLHWMYELPTVKLTECALTANNRFLVYTYAFQVQFCTWYLILGFVKTYSINSVPNSCLTCIYSFCILVNWWHFHSLPSNSTSIIWKSPGSSTCATVFGFLSSSSMYSPVLQKSFHRQAPYFLMSFLVHPSKTSLQNVKWLCGK